MKRNIYSFLMAAALCGAVSCSEEINTETPEGAGYITVTSQVGSLTKAGYETKTLPAEFVMDINQGAAAEYNYYVLMQKDVASNIYNESTGKNLAWASTDHSKVTVRAITVPDGASLDANQNLNINIEPNQTTNENFLKNDILGASINNGISIVKDNIVVSFRHLMSKLHVIYEVADGSMVESIQLKNVAIKGAYSFADMDYVSNSNPDKGDITMFLNAGTQYGLFAAEAIFCPYTPTTNPTLAVKIKDITNPVSCDVSLPANFSFEGGKRYVMKIKINENGTVQTTSISAENDWVKNVPGGKILWIGTSIPAGNGTNNYPQMVANATGLQVINNAVGGSVMLKPVPSYSFDVATWNYLYAGGLSQTHAEAESGIRPKLVAAANNYNDPNKTEEQLQEIRNTWVTEQLNIVKSLSYQSLIIPYINGTLDKCETIIIDHGFNDLPRMALEAGAFGGWNPVATSPEGYTYYAEEYFDAWVDGRTVATGDITPTYEHYKLHLQNTQWDNTSSQAVLIKEDSYLLAMESIINECRKVNPNINIIIGNYFAEHTTWLNFAHYQGGLTQYRLAHVLLDYNRVAAKIFDCLDIVNVYKHLNITDTELWSGSGTYLDPVKLSGFQATIDNSKFCPDGVHPSSDVTGKSNRAIADVYLQELKRIFSSPATKSSANSYDYGWEDVEIL